MRKALFFVATVVAAFGLGATAFVNVSNVKAKSSETLLPAPTPEKIKIAAAAPTGSENGVFDLIEFDGVQLVHTEDEWKHLLTPEQYYILRQAGTEAPYSGALEKNHERGVYYCAACGLALFRSKTKFESGTGWPSFYEPIYKKNVIQKDDRSLPEEDRTEILCARCHSHLGHVFDDGPPPTGLRYCMNSLALKFKASK